MIRISRLSPLALLLALVAGCASHSSPRARVQDEFGVLVMAHGGRPEWNQGVLSAVAPLRDRYDIEVAFGMADAASIDEAVRRLEARGVRKIGVVRLFVSGESWYERTEQILGVAAGAPARPTPAGHAHAAHGHDHAMAFWKVETEASFALSKQGLAEAPEMGVILADRASALSRRPELEDVLILAHGPGDDGENERWLGHLDARADAVRQRLPFRRVRVETLREDWPEKRAEAARRIRAFVQGAADEGGRAVVVPFRVYGFGPYRELLGGLDYVSDGVGLIPHRNVTSWLEQQVRTLQPGPFRNAASR